MKKVKLAGLYERSTSILFIGSPELNPDELQKYLAMFSFLELFPKKLRKHMELGNTFTSKTFPAGKSVTLAGYNCYFPIFSKRRKLEALKEYFEPGYFVED